MLQDLYDLFKTQRLKITNVSLSMEYRLESRISSLCLNQLSKHVLIYLARKMLMDVIPKNLKTNIFSFNTYMTQEDDEDKIHIKLIFLLDKVIHSFPVQTIT